MIGEVQRIVYVDYLHSAHFYIGGEQFDTFDTVPDIYYYYMIWSYFM